jgi:hypothetical protein
MNAMRDYGPRDKNARNISYFNGWLLLCTFTPMLLLLGMKWFLETPSLGTMLFLLVAPLVMGWMAWQAIRFGKGLR